MSKRTFAAMKRLGDGFYDDGHGGLHVDVDEFVSACGGDPRCQADVDKALDAIRDSAGEIPVLVLEK